MAAYTRKDAAYRAAKRSGYRSRAALKLADLDRRYRLLRRGACVVELGCWPGGWLQVAAEAVGPGGSVVGVDREPVEALGLANVTTVVGDVTDGAVRARVKALLPRAADLVLCDLAPKLSGVKVADRERHLALVGVAVEWALELLAPNGRAVVKLFSQVEPEATRLLGEAFAEVRKLRPPTTRQGSAEIYAVVSRPRART